MVYDWVFFGKCVRMCCVYFFFGGGEIVDWLCLLKGLEGRVFGMFVFLMMFLCWVWFFYVVLYVFVIFWWWLKGDVEVWFGVLCWVVMVFLGDLFVVVIVNVFIYWYWFDVFEDCSDD